MADDTATPRVNIVITCHNYGEFVSDAIQSALDQSFEDFVVTVVDDGSTDDSLEVIRSFAEDPRVRVIDQANAGVCAARNAGIAAVESEFAVTLDADDLIHPDFLSFTVAALDENPSAGFAYTWMVYFGLQELLIASQPYDFDNLLRENYVNTTSLFRRSAWEAAGGYDDSIGGYEDWDFWISMGESGLGGIIVPEPLFAYRRHGASLVDLHDESRERLKERIKAKHHAAYVALEERERRTRDRRQR
ncbi:MAG: glycosyltransferase family 2 protein [Coriobacteriia bacterium]|nr:glycosyltransferase family 2 protein [Coriobacteriia bacterium]